MPADLKIGDEVWITSAPGLMGKIVSIERPRSQKTIRYVVRLDDLSWAMSRSATRIVRVEPKNLKKATVD